MLIFKTSRYVFLPLHNCKYIAKVSYKCMCFRFSYFKLKCELMRVRVGLSIDISILLGYVEVSEIFGKYSEIVLIEAWVYLPFFYRQYSVLCQKQSSSAFSHLKNVFCQFHITISIKAAIIQNRSSL